MGVVILLLIGVYVLVSVGFVKLVGKFTGKKKLFKYLAIVVCVLLPTWNIVLGMLVYFPACLFIPKTYIYETAETDGIYYEGMHSVIFKLQKTINNEPLSERIQLGLDPDVYFPQGYTYVESRVDKEMTETYGFQSIRPVYYQCTLLPKDEKRPYFRRTNCSVVNQPMSRYVVKATGTHISNAGIGHIKIVDRTTGKLMAEDHSVTLSFRFWFYDFDGMPKSISCCKTKNDYFEFDVLKPIK